VGYYIETPGQSKGKAEAIIREHGGRMLLHAPATLSQLEEGEALVCVVDNGPFEAAAFCYSEEELTEFASPDPRRRQWLAMDRAKACELTGYKD